MLFSDGMMTKPESASETPTSSPPSKRARHAAEPADDDDDEGEQRVVGGDIGLHVDEQQHQRARRADAGRAEPEGDGVEPLHVEADDLRADLVVGAGADRLAGAGEAEEAPERGDADDRAERREDPHLVEQQAADLVAVVGIVELDVARVGPERHQHACW